MSLSETDQAKIKEINFVKWTNCKNEEKTN